MPIVDPVPLGIYISIPFCRAKCTYCNFASGVFSAQRLHAYVARLCAEIEDCRPRLANQGIQVPCRVDSIYFGGGTPSTLAPGQLRQVFDALRRAFDVVSGAEITVECAPGQIDGDFLASAIAAGVNRVSLGVQSFIDAEAATVGRRHTRTIVLEDLARLRDAGLSQINLDLIAGLPHQTAESWRESLGAVLATDMPHVSVYMLDVDEDSRLGREMLSGGRKYGAQQTPEEDAIAAMYTEACNALERGGLLQYEISNFARPGHASRHNLKYWDGAPYLGLGLDAHSCLPAPDGTECRIANPDGMDAYMAGASASVESVSRAGQLEERWFLGLRRTCGVSWAAIHAEFGADALEPFHAVVQAAADEGLLEREGGQVRLTSRGRLFANEVFARFLGVAAQAMITPQNNFEREMTIA